jgi:hypothetical protein
MPIKINIGKRESRSRISSLFGGIICLSMALFGIYAAFFAPSFDSGIPLVPDTWNQTIGRFTIGGGAILLFLLAGYAFYEAVTWNKSES